MRPARVCDGAVDGAVEREDHQVTDARALQPGDRVIATVFAHRGKTGVVLRMARKSAVVRFDDGDEYRVHLDDLRLETAEDIAYLQRKAAMIAWRADRPPLKRASVQTAPYHGSEETGAHIVGQLSTSSEMRDAADDLMALANWFDAKPRG
jgi:hypothetical protein